MRARLWSPILIGILLIPTSALSADGEYTGSRETEFMRGGQITIELSAGEHRIVRSEDQHIRVHWTLADEREDVEAQTTVKGSTARVGVDGPREDFRTVIEVPEDSDLTVRLTAGMLKVHDVGGDRDIRLRAGELHIEVENPKNYAGVAGSLWAGEIDGGPFNLEASGLFRSIDWQGEGENKLQFKLYAGEVRLYGAE